jgi:hypothetical protein
MCFLLPMLPMLHHRLFVLHCRGGVRPAAAVQVDISRSFAPAASSSSSSSGVHAAAAAAESAQEQLLHSDSSGSDEEDIENWQQQGSNHNVSLDASLDAASNIDEQQQQRLSTEADASPPVEGLFTSSEMQQLSALLGGATPQQQQQPSGAAAEAGVEGSAHFQRVNAKLDAFGQGLVDRLMALEDAGGLRVVLLHEPYLYVDGHYIKPLNNRWAG